MKKGKHLDIDLDFLDEEASKVKAKSSDGSTQEKTTKVKVKWKNIAIIGGIILFSVWLGWLGSLESGTSSSTNYSNTSSTTSYNSQSDDVTVGQYRCSSYSSSQADKLKPSYTESEIDAEGTALEQRAGAIEQSANKIDTMYVDETSQYAIDSYNSLVSSHNTEIDSFKKDYAAYEAKLDRFNAQVDAYNNYLETNCHKVR